MSATEILQEVRQMPYDDIKSLEDEIHEIGKAAWEDQLLRDMEESERLSKAGLLPSETVEELWTRLNAVERE